MSYHIRAAHIGDVPRIHQLILDLAAFEQLSHLVVSSPTDLSRALFGPHARVEALVAESSGGEAVPGTVVAFALHFQNYSTFLGRHGLYLEDLYVDPAWRRRGIARGLLQALAGIAVARGCGRFEWSVLDWNRDAISFYQGCGCWRLPGTWICRTGGSCA